MGRDVWRNPDTVVTRTELSSNCIYKQLTATDSSITFPWAEPRHTYSLAITLNDKWAATVYSGTVRCPISTQVSKARSANCTKPRISQAIAVRFKVKNFRILFHQAKLESQGSA